MSWGKEEADSGHQVRTSKAVTGAVLRRSKDFVSYSIHKSMRTDISLCLNKKCTLPFLFSIKKKNVSSHLLSRCSSDYHYLLIHIEIAGLQCAFCSCFVRVISTFGWEAQRPVEHITATMLDTYFLHFMEGNWGMEKLINLAKLTWLRREKIRFWTQTA